MTVILALDLLCCEFAAFGVAEITSNARSGAEQRGRKAVALAGDGRGVHALAFEVLRDHPRAFGHRVRLEEPRHVGERSVVDQPGDTFEQAGHERAREPGAYLGPPIAD